MLRTDDLERVVATCTARLELHFVGCEVCRVGDKWVESFGELCTGAVRLRRVHDQAARLLERKGVAA